MIAKKVTRSRNLAGGSSVNQLSPAQGEAKTKMPTIYTSNDFVLIILHRRQAGTISLW
jgi:hypothetical protein